MLQRAASHPETLPLQKRKGLFQLCLHTVKDPEHYLKYWFRGASLSDIKRENVKGKSLAESLSKLLTRKELFCWAFLNKAAWGPDDDEELEEYADKTETLLGRKLEPGRGKAVCLRITIDEVKTMYRSCKFLWQIYSLAGADNLPSVLVPGMTPSMVKPFVSAYSS